MLSRIGRATLMCQLEIGKEFMNDVARTISRPVTMLAQSEYGLLLAYMAFLVAIGFFITPDFGMSFDEHIDAGRGEESLKAYVGPTVFREAPEVRFRVGAPYFMTFSLSSKLLSGLNESWLRADGRHFTNFLSFQVAILGVYMIARKLLSKPYAFLTAVLFSTQPLLFGHAFINQKDVPFMAVFTMSVALGLSATDDWASMASGSLPRMSLVSQLRNHLDDVREAWSRAKWSQRLAPGLILLFAAVIAVELFNEGYFLPWLRSVVADLYVGRGWPPLVRLFARLAEDAYKTPIEAYLRKVDVLHAGLRLVVVPMATALAVVSAERVYSRTIAPSRSQFRVALLKTILAASLLGIATPMREVAPLAGVLVSLYMIYRRGWSSLPQLATYWAVAAAIAYAAWPALWGNPFQAFAERLILVSSFPVHTILYQGTPILSGSLPWHYLPTLMGFQFTEAALLGMALGLFFIVIAILGRRIKPIPILLAVWVGVPAMAVMIIGTPIYGNFRHVFFSVPPLIILAGYGWTRLLEKIRPKYVRIGIVLLLLIPGIYSILKAHPYQYVYYNVLVGGVEGAARQYELDHWCTSYREAMEFINVDADEGAVVAAQIPIAAANAFAREDITVVLDGTNAAADAQYFLGCKRAAYDDTFHPEAEIVYQVRRGDAIFSVVRKAVTGPSG